MLPVTKHIYNFIIFSEDQQWFWQKHQNKLHTLLGKLFVFAFTWAIGGVLRREDEHEGETLIGINTTQNDLINLTREFNYLVHDLFEKRPPASKFYASTLFTTTPVLCYLLCPEVCHGTP